MFLFKWIQAISSALISRRLILCQEFPTTFSCNKLWGTSRVIWEKRCLYRQMTRFKRKKKKLFQCTFWPGWEILTHTVVDPCQRIINTKEMGLCSITYEGLIYVKNAKGFILKNLSYKMSSIITLKLNAKIKLTK